MTVTKVCASRSRIAPLQLLGVIIFWPQIAGAYIDPGTGSALVYLVTGIVVSVFFAVRGLYYRAIELAFRSKYPGQKCEVAIHSEDPRYEITFLPVLSALHDLGVKTTYFTMYERDVSFTSLPDLFMPACQTPKAPAIIEKTIASAT